MLGAHDSYEADWLDEAVPVDVDGEEVGVSPGVVTDVSPGALTDVSGSVFHDCTEEGREMIN